MPDTLDVDELTAAAAEAAGQDDAATAVRFLRRALDLQVASFGPDHRELAPTLNNLALMLERQGQPDEAERCYRRAYEIAQRGARPNDPLVLVSRANLHAFLKASGISDPELEEPDVPPRARRPVERAAEPPRAPAPPASPPTPAVTAPPPVAPAPTVAAQPGGEPARAARSAAPPGAPPVPRRAPSVPRTSPLPPPAPGRARSFGWLAATGAVAGAFAAWIFLAPSPASRTETPTGGANQPPQTAAAPPVTPSAPQATSSAAAPGPPAAVPAPAPAEPPAAPPAPAPPAPDPNPDGLSADARLCAALIRTAREWRCDAVGNPVDSDAVYYYTRVRTPRDAVMRHRWTYEGEVVRTVNLEVRANLEAGFRTFSRQTVSGRDPGAWEVALIAPDGTVIDTQRFEARRQEVGGRR